MSAEYVYGNIGVTNTSIGNGALENIITGADNTAFGTNTFKYITSGDGNSGFGIDVISTASGNPSFNTGFGTEALKNVTSGLNNSAFGYQSLLNVTTGGNNTGIGKLSGSLLADGSNNTLIGANATVSSSSENGVTAIGSGDVGIGTNVQGTDDDVLVGYGIRSGGECVKIGVDNSLDEDSFYVISLGKSIGSLGTNIGRFAEVMIGHEVMQTPDPDYFPSYSESVVLGKHAGRYCTESFSDLILGVNACENSGLTLNSVIAGARANQLPTTPNAFSTNVTIVGYEAGINSIRNGSNDGKTIIGAFSGESIVEEEQMTIVGYETMKNAQGSYNTAIGYRALLGSATYTVPSASVGTAVGAGKLTSIMTTIPGTQHAGDVVDIDCTGATSAGLDGTYYLMASKLYEYYVWFNVDNATTDPGPPGLNLPALVGKMGIPVNINSGDTVSQITAAIKNDMSVTNPNGDFDAYTLNQLTMLDIKPNANGNTTDIADVSAVGDGKLYSVVKTADGTAGTQELSRVDVGAYTTAANLSARYFLISSPTVDYYVWFKREFYDSDPALVGKTGVEINVSDSLVNEWVVSQEITNKLIATGDFTVTTPTNFVRVVNKPGAINNIAVGNNALTNATVSSNNVVMGSDAAPSLTSGYNNVLMGRSTDSASNTKNTTVLGGGAFSAGDGAVVLGAGASAAAAAINGFVIGSGVAITAANEFQFGQSAVSGAATMQFRSQTICDEAWIGGGNTKMLIDNTGDIIRDTPTTNTGSTTDATALALVTWPVAINTALRVEALVTGRRTGGTAGTINDSMVVRIDGAFKNNGGVMSKHLVLNVVVEDQAAWDVDYTINGTNIELSVTGEVNNNVDWETEIRTFIV